jgi:chitinase
MIRITTLLSFLLFLALNVSAQSANNFTVIAYYSAGPEQVDSLAVEKLTHIIYSFCHLKGNKLTVDNKRDSLTIQRLVGLKKRNAKLKVILSLGGWGGCASCSEVFNSDAGRTEFTQSVLALNQYFKTDGLDLDWEYPTIEGYPGHQYIPADKQNFTALIKELRKAFGTKYQISFAAGGFQKFLDESVEWKVIMPLVDRVNLMTYDLINGYSMQTGHHTALYSRPEQAESTDNAVQYLIKLGIPRNKLVIGAAFYGRMWEGVPAENNGLYRPGKFKAGIDFKNFPTELSKEKGFIYYWDDIVKAPYLYNPSSQLFVTYDDKRSIALKTQYVVDQHLDGIMFWELSLDPYRDGLLQVIDDVKKNYKAKAKR